MKFSGNLPESLFSPLLKYLRQSTFLPAKIFLPFCRFVFPEEKLVSFGIGKSHVLFSLSLSNFSKFDNSTILRLQFLSFIILSFFFTLGKLFLWQKNNFSLCVFYFCVKSVWILNVCIFVFSTGKSWSEN